jgi:hypothetical protein
MLEASDYINSILTQKQSLISKGDLRFVEIKTDVKKGLESS